MLSIQCKGLTRLIVEFKNYPRTIEEKTRELVERLMQAGYDVADAGFKNAVYAGTNDVYVWKPFWDGNRMVLQATSDKGVVAFIEFGAGTYYEGYPDPVMQANSGAVGRGQYGGKHGENPPWVYVGDPGNAGFVKAEKKSGKRKGQLVVETMGNPPARAMYNASKKFDLEEVVAMAREVFK